MTTEKQMAELDAASLSRIRESEFPVIGKWKFFNHAACSPLPKRAALAMESITAAAPVSVAPTGAHNSRASSRPSFALPLLPLQRASPLCARGARGARNTRIKQRARACAAGAPGAADAPPGRAAPGRATAGPR